MRFTLGKMFLAIAMLALACAGMKYHNRGWTIAVFTVTIAMYLCIAIRTFTYRGRQLDVARGFLLVGSVYLLILLSSVARDMLLTNWPLAVAARALDLPDPSIIRPLPLNTIIARAWPWYNESGATGPELPLYYFFAVGHLAFSWIFAVLAAWFAGRMYDRQERLAKEPI